LRNVVRSVVGSAALSVSAIMPIMSAYWSPEPMARKFPPERTLGSCSVLGLHSPFFQPGALAFLPPSNIISWVGTLNR
jgi:hypothetical protein